jgi:hypothetical protein
MKRLLTLGALLFRLLFVCSTKWEFKSIERDLEHKRRCQGLHYCLRILKTRVTNPLSLTMQQLLWLYYSEWTKELYCRGNQVR